MSCRLIINADDFGWSEGVNEAVCRLHDAGIVTSASLMVGAPAAADAVARLRAREGLAVGLHVVTACGPAVLPARRLPRIVDRHGWLDKSFIRAGIRYTLSPRCRRELRMEVEAQFEAFAALGLPWSHVDSHLHMTLTPAVFREVVRLAGGYRVRGLRIPEDDYRLYQRLDPEDARRQRWLAAQFAVLARRQRPALAGSGHVVPRFCYGIFRSGRLAPSFLAALVRALPEGLFELHCHPDLSTPGGTREYEALRSDLFREALAGRGVVLTTCSGA